MAMATSIDADPSKGFEFAQPVAGSLIGEAAGLLDVATGELPLRVLRMREGVVNPPASAGGYEPLGSRLLRSENSSSRRGFSPEPSRSNSVLQNSSLTW